MNRLDRYYNMTHSNGAPPLPRKGILMVPPPPPPFIHRPPQISHTHQWPYQTNPQIITGPAVLLPNPGNPGGHHHVLPQHHHHPHQAQYAHVPGGGTYIHPHQPLSKRTAAIRSGRRDYADHASVISTSQNNNNLASAMAIPDSPKAALQRLLLFYENGHHREVAALMKRLSFSSFRQILPSLPGDIFVESMPHSLPILEALYAKLYMSSDRELILDRSSMGLANLRPEAVVWQLVKFFASQQEEAKITGERWEFCGPFISSCKRLLSILLQAEPKLKRVVLDRKKALMKAIESLGQHGLVGTSDEKLMNLHDALKLEFMKVQKTYGEALTKLESMSLVGSIPVVNKPNGTISGRRPPPIAQSHQRQLSLRANEIQLRLIKNKTLLNAIEPALENTALEVLLGILQKRIELDKECLFQFTQVKRESKLTGDDSQSVAPILMRYQRGCQQVLDLMKEVSNSKMVEDEVEENLSDISGGYHSDSESCVMTSGNSPFISKEARYNFLSRSIRLGSKHNFRSSLIASSLCQDTLSVHSSSLGSVKRPISMLSKSLPRIATGNHGKEEEFDDDEEEDEELPPRNTHLAIHSSSGISSGSSDAGNEEDPIAGDSSVGGDESTICSPSICSSDTLKTNLSSNRSTQRQNRHAKLRSKPALPGASNAKSSLIGTVEHDISVIRKDAEITALKSQINQLQSEISLTQNQVFELKDNERRLKENLRDEREKSMTFEKIITKNTLSGQLSERGSYEADKRKARTELVRKYGDLYSTLRLETLDELDRLPQLINSDELKNKLLFSVVVLSFRSITTAVQSKRDSLRRIFQLPNSSLNLTKNDEPLETIELARRDIEEALSVYLRRAADNFDLSKNVEEVCDQIWATLYDYPCLKSCDAIIKYVKECVRTAWGLVNQMPSYVIEYEKRHVDPDCHVRYHSSDQDSNQIKTYLWPALFEGKNGPCVQKGVVIT